MEIVGNGDDLALIMFTSGTTGVPKGVIILNKQLTLGAYAFKNIFNVSSGDVLGAYLSFSFIGSFVIYATLIWEAVQEFSMKKSKRTVYCSLKNLRKTI